MSLPSQLPRSSRAVNFRAYPDRRRSRLSRALVFSTLLIALGMLVWWMWFAPAEFKERLTGPKPVSASPTHQPAEKVSLRLDQPQQRPVSPGLERRGLAQANQTAAASNPPTSPVSPTLGSSLPTDTKPQPPASAAPQPSAPMNSSAPVRGDAIAASTSAPAPAPTTTPTTTKPNAPPQRESLIASIVSQGDALLSARQPVEARLVYNRALHDPRAGLSDADALRRKLTELNATLVFSPTVVPGDPLVETYALQSGDRLASVVGSRQLGIDWRFIQRVNMISDPSRLRQGQKVKLVRGPFHAVVTKSAYRMDVYASAKDPDGNNLYIRSFPVGLGENNSTPLGRFVVRPTGKLIDPHWVNPRTGERFAKDDPKNPIGERWIGLDGADQNTEVLAGYGIHGTIEPQSIGTDASMGCIRMLPGDVEIVYEMLVEHDSTVEIRP